MTFAALLPLGYLFGGVVVRFVTNRGEVVVEVEDPDAQVTLKEGDVIVDARKGNRRITLTAGEHQLTVTVRNTDGQAKSFTRAVVLARGGEQVVETAEGWEVKGNQNSKGGLR